MTSTITCPSTESSTRTRWSFTPPRSFLALNTCTGDNTRSSSSELLQLKDNDYDDDDCISNLDCWTWDQNLRQLVQTTYSVSGPETCQHIAGWAWCVLPSVIIMMIMIVIVTTIMIVIILPSVMMMMMIMHRWWYHDAAAATHWSTNMIISFSPGHVRISDLGLACDFRFSLKIFHNYQIYKKCCNLYNFLCGSLANCEIFQQKETPCQCRHAWVHGSRG